MAFVIESACVGVCDQACVEVCPMDCIGGPVPLEELAAVPRARRAAVYPGVQLFIDPESCIDCGACAVACPVEAIVHEDDAREADAPARNAAFWESRSGGT